MKIWVHKASKLWREGEIREYSGLEECVKTLLDTEDYGSFEPGVIVSKADDMKKDISGCEECEYDVMIYDTYIE